MNMKTGTVELKATNPHPNHCPQSAGWIKETGTITNGNTLAGDFVNNCGDHSVWQGNYFSGSCSNNKVLKANETTPMVNENGVINKPKATDLIRVYPNPFSVSTTISYELLTNDHITITVFNRMGETIKILADKMQAKGNYSLIWNARDINGAPVEKGVYFISIKTNSTAQSLAMAVE
jgi:hypothetical protein